MGIKFDLYDKIKEAYKKDDTMRIIQEKVQRGEASDFVIDSDVLKLGHSLCAPQMTKLKVRILKEAHCTPYTVHPGSTKMYQNLGLAFGEMERKMVQQSLCRANK